MLFTRIPIGQQALRFVACQGATPRYVATPRPFDLSEDSKIRLRLSFRPLGQLACTGTGRDLSGAYEPISGLGRARGFGAATLLDDGRIWIGGGASEFDGNLLDTSAATPGWDIYDPADLVFLGGTARSTVINTRDIGPRIGMSAVPYNGSAGQTPGVLIIGGASRLTLDITAPSGPLNVDAGDLVSPFVSFFDTSTAQVSPVSGPPNSLPPRLFVGAAGDGRHAVIAGGLEPETGAPSRVVDVIAAGEIVSHRLPVGLYGPTATLLDANYALVWGGSPEDCGATPGWLVPLDGSPPSPLALDGSDAPPACPAPDAPLDADCRAWYPTAHHSATLLEPNGAGRPRVLITGGLRIRGNRLVSNPYFGDGCRANAFVVTIDTGAKRGTLTTINLDAPGLNDALQRAFHGSAIVGDQGLISGGWVLGAAAAALTPTGSVVPYTDRLAAGTFSVDALPETTPRLGHMVVPTQDGTVLLAGGIRLTPSGLPEATNLAEIYSPPIDDVTCGLMTEAPQ